MDFNSLYPSIIQEYNICFSTLQEKNDINLINTSDSINESYGDSPGILPREIKKLVERRKDIKKLLKTEKNIEKRQQV